MGSSSSTVKHLASTRRVVVIAGPTAVGKSALALKLCEELQGELISVDSVQVYRGLRIGSNKPSEAEVAAVRHRCHAGSSLYDGALLSFALLLCLSVCASVSLSRSVFVSMRLSVSVFLSLSVCVLPSACTCIRANMHTHMHTCMCVRILCASVGGWVCLASLRAMGARAQVECAARVRVRRI